MCGIVGQIGLSPNTNINPNEIETMLSMIEHRGPNGQGFFYENNYGIAMKRLSIIDIENGNQPIFNEDKSVVVILNGEIYNYKEIRNDLQKKGHFFSTKSDTEVLVHLYEEYGIKFINKINGMFSFCLIDRNTSKTYLVRDRIGIKPLYYVIKNDKLYFSSEIKSIIQCKDIERNVDEVGLSHYLSFNYLPQPYTLFKDIKKVIPGNYIFINESQVSHHEYWEIPMKNNNDLDESTLINEINSRLKESVKIRLRSDVPLGAFLSGGVDSSTIVAKTSFLTKNRLNTFSIGFAEEKFSEIKYSKTIAEKFNTIHHTKIVKPDLINQLPKTIWYNDNPHGDVSFMPTNTLSQLASERVTVVLTGDGGDELFAGYDKYIKFENFKSNLKNFRKYFEDISVFNLNYKKSLLDEKFKKRLDMNLDSFNLIKKHYLKYKKNNSDFINSILFTEIKFLLEGNNLVKPDRMGMAESIEARVPFLDHKFVEFVSSIPSKYKIRNKETKYILKKSVEAFLPHEIIYRDKQMFTVPIGEWFKKDLRNLVYNVLLDEKTLKRGFFNKNVIITMINQHMSEEIDRTRELRNLIILEIWFRMFIDKKYKKCPSLDDLGINI